MIIQIGTEVDESRILWKHKESDEWKRADIDDLIEAYEGRPKGEWIPVSERLPENNGRYLVCYVGIVGMRTNILHYGVPSPLHTRGTEKCFYDVDREYGDVPYEDVVAWQPLPEPYKGGDTE